MEKTSCEHDRAAVNGNWAVVFNFNSCQLVEPRTFTRMRTLNSEPER